MKAPLSIWVPRVLLPIVVALVGSAIPAIAQAPATGVVGHWTFDDPAGSTSAIDSSLALNNAQCNPSVPTYIGTGQSRTADCPTFGVPGEQATAAAFDGVNDFLAVVNNIAGSFTVAAWIRTTQAGGGWGPAYSGTGIVWSDQGGPANDMIPMALVNGRLAFGTGENCGAGYDTLTSSVPVNTGQWVHVAVTRDEATGIKRMYVNGAFDGTDGGGGTCPLNANGMIALGANPLDGRYFDGQLDDVYFYDRVLTDAEIQSFVAKPPAITSLTTSTTTIWPPNRQMVPVTLSVTATGTPQPACAISSVSSNEASSAPGAPDWTVTGPLSVLLRADRLGSGNGRVYSIVVTCTNSAGSASETATVTVPHDQRK